MVTTDKQCRECKWLHVGTGVSHNHCDVGISSGDHSWDSYEQRANGREVGRCDRFEKGQD